MNLPTNIDAERLVLGSILLDDTAFVAVAGALSGDDFSLEKHRRIFRRMAEIHESGGSVDRVTVANALMAAGELDSVDGFSYLVTLDDGLPHIPNIDDYIRIVKDKATLRRIVFASQKLGQRAMNGDEEPAKILADAGADILRLAEACSNTSLLSPAEIVAEAGGMDAYVNRRNKTTGLATGFPRFDVMTGGLKPGALYILAARPAMGKSALSLNLIERVSVPPAPRESVTSIVFSLEMERGELLDRLICSRARVNTQRFGGGYLNAEERRAVGTALGEIAVDDRILIDDKANTSTQEIHAKIRKQQARGPVGLVVVDYLQLMIDGKDEFRVAAASRISRELKLIAKDCRVPVVALSQLSRACEQRGKALDDFRPRMSDLRESGSLEQDADVVMSVFRGEVYFKDREDLKGLADLEILKQRGGPIGVIPMVWIGEVVRFEERADGVAEPED